MDVNFGGVRYYKLNIFLLSTLGLWPYENRTIKLVKNIFLGFVLVCGLVFQLTTFLTVEYDRQLLLKNLSPMVAILMFMLKFFTFWLKNEIVGRVMEEIKNDWNATEDAEELMIIEKHSYVGSYHAKIFTMLLYPVTFATVLSPFTSQILDIIAPLNESRPYRLPVMIECFIDQEKYFYVLALFSDVASIVGTTAFISTEAIFISFLQHNCGLFEVVGYRIKKAFTRASFRGFIVESDYGMHEALVRAICMHNRAMEFTNILKESFTFSYFLLLAVGMASIIIDLFRLSQALSLLSDFDELVLSTLLCIGQMSYMFYINFMIQGIVDWSSYIFMDAYNADWYKAPIFLRKTLLFVMLKSIKNLNFDLYGFFAPSIEGFFLLVRIATSYLMVLKSLQ